MTHRDRPSGLRAAREARGWSQSEAARELASLARSRDTPVASAASLKTLLSRWENGHSAPESQYRRYWRTLCAARSPSSASADG